MLEYCMKLYFIKTMPTGYKLSEHKMVKHTNLIYALLDRADINTTDKAKPLSEHQRLFTTYSEQGKIERK